MVCPTITESEWGTAIYSGTMPLIIPFVPTLWPPALIY